MAEALAGWCLSTGQSPEVYRSLTRLERSEFIRLATKRNR